MLRHRTRSHTSSGELSDELVLVVVDVEQVRQTGQVEHSHDRPVRRNSGQVQLAVYVVATLASIDQQRQAVGAQERHRSQVEHDMAGSGRGLVLQVGAHLWGGDHVEFADNGDDDDVVTDLTAGQLQCRAAELTL